MQDVAKFRILATIGFPESPVDPTGHGVGSSLFEGPLRCELDQLC
jgi:hypothetical protein